LIIGKALFVMRGVLRLLVTVLACLMLAAIGYGLILACILLFPPHAVL
jgi:hypothetical protein